MDIYLAGALTTAVAIVFSPKFNTAGLRKEIPEAWDWSERYTFVLTSIALLVAALSWPVFWLFKMVRWITAR